MSFHLNVLMASGYFLALVIGFSLGLIGGGGSILTIPVLVFFFGIDPVIATTYSLFIVGITAICGSINHYRMRNIDYKTVISFGIPSVIVLFIVRRWLIGLIPGTILKIQGWVLTKQLLIMIVFSILMLLAGWYMIRRKNYVLADVKENKTRLMLHGAITGAITGFIGIGGGFIIVPSLALFAKLPMKKAIGTSLTIISINCIVGILGNWRSDRAVDYGFLGLFSVFAIAGIFLGTRMIRVIPEKNLKPIFGWVILVMSVVVFVRIFMEHF